MRILFFILLFIQQTLAQPIALHPDNPHYFIYQGKPLVLITSAEHYGAIMNLDFNYVEYLNTLQKDGMNYTRIFTGTYVEPQGAFGIGNNTLAPAPERVLLPWPRSQEPGYRKGGSKFDLSKWDEQYFNRMRDFVNQAARRNIIVEITLFSSIYTGQNWAVNPFNADNNINRTIIDEWKLTHTTGNGNLWPFQESLVRKIANELNGFENIFYEIQNEPWSDQTIPSLIFNPYDRTSFDTWYKRSDLASSGSLAWQNQIALVIKDVELQLKNRHLIAQNYCNFKYPLKNVEDEISILNFHYAYPEAVRWNYGWDRVIGYDETGFAGSDDEIFRKQAWRFILSGGGLFNNLDYSFVTGHEDGTFVNRAPGGGSATLRKQLSVLQNFVQSIDFIDMTPDYSVVKKAPGILTFALSKPGAQYAIYLDGVGPCTLSLVLPDGVYDAVWINPQSGESQTNTIVGSKDVYFLRSPEFDHDLALRIVRKK